MNNVSIFVEGPDRSGKSTQILNILKWLQTADKINPTHVLHYFGATGLKDDVAEYVLYSKKMYEEMFNLSSIKGNNFIFDRSHLGELVYGPLYRKYTGKYVLDLESEYLKWAPTSRKNFLLVFTDTPENLLKREDGNSLSGDDLELKRQEVELFLNAYRMSKIEHKLIVNITLESEEETKNKIINFITKILEVDF